MRIAMLLGIPAFPAASIKEDLKSKRQLVWPIYPFQGNCHRWGADPTTSFE
jgi:hypothetical protein